jgi:hypothetical protein
MTQVRKAVLGWFALGGALAAADTLLPGDTQFKTNPSVPAGPRYSTALPPFATGANEVGTLNSPITGEFQGSVTTHVYADPDTGFLSFGYVFALTDMNTAGIVRATMGGWNGVNITDVGADASGNSGTFDGTPEWLDGDPLDIDRDPHSQGLAFQWRGAIGPNLIGTVIGPGDISSQIFVSTELRQFTRAEIDMIDTTVTGEAEVLVPIPEPASIALLLVGLAYAAFPRRR